MDILNIVQQIKPEVVIFGGLTLVSLSLVWVIIMFVKTFLKAIQKKDDQIIKLASDFSDTVKDVTVELRRQTDVIADIHKGGGCKVSPEHCEYIHKRTKK